MNEYKIVTLSYIEQASLVIKAQDNSEAETIIWEEFSNIPGLQILSIEDCPDDVVAQLAQREQEQEDLFEQPKVLN